MIKKIRIQLHSMKHSKQFVLDHPIVPPNVLVTATATALGNSITTIETIDGTRIEGSGTYRGAVEERKFARTQLHTALSDLSAVSKTLDKATHPDVAAQLKMSHCGNTYQGLLGFARAAVAIVEPKEQVFVDHGAAATVVEDLEALIAALEAASNRKNSGLDSKVGKNAALAAAAKIGMTHVRMLDSILSQLYKGNVELYTAWKAAKRLQRTLPDEEPTPPPAGSGSGSGTQTVPA